MSGDLDDTGEIPILTEAVLGIGGPAEARAIQSTILADVLNLADSLLHRAAKDIEATLFENVLDRLRAELPEIVARALRERGDPAIDEGARTD